MNARKLAPQFEGPALPDVAGPLCVVAFLVILAGALWAAGYRGGH